MSNIPPAPERYANYPRGTASNAEVLRKIADAYYGFGKAFLYTILVGLGSALLHLLSQNEAFQLAVVGIRFVGLAVFIYWITLPLNRKYGEALGWPEGKARNQSILMAVIALFCFGIIAFIWGQSIGASEMTRLGVPKKWYGFSKKAVYAYIDSLPSATAQSAPVPPMSV